MTPIISVLVPGIRNEKWIVLYNSIKMATSLPIETIFIGPYELPEVLKDKEDVKYIQSWQSPIACQQLALQHASGEYISWAADDGVYLPGVLDIAYNSLQNEPYTTIVTGKYLEGDNPMGMLGDEYYTLQSHHSMQMKGVPKECLMLNCGLVHRALLQELGGWDAYTFEVCPLAYTDFAIRAYRFGCKFILQDGIMFRCSHMPGRTGDHGPIDIAQTMKDTPMFMGIYATDSYLTRSKIALDNWKYAPEVWGVRFNKEGV